MSDSIPDVTMKAFDLDSIENVEDNPEAVTFEILLSLEPSAHWLEEFDFTYKRTPFTLKPPVLIRLDRMKITYLPRYSDELPAYLRFLAGVMAKATEETKRTQQILQTDEKERIRTSFRSTLVQTPLPSPAVIR